MGEQGNKGGCKSKCGAQPEELNRISKQKQQLLGSKCCCFVSEIACRFSLEFVNIWVEYDGYFEYGYTGKTPFLSVFVSILLVRIPSRALLE